MAMLSCPYLGGAVELTEERERHIRNRHPDLLPDHGDCIIATVADPDQARRSSRVGNAVLLTKWFPDLRGGRHVVAVIVDDPAHGFRPWIITAYLARKLAEGEVEWRKN